MAKPPRKNGFDAPEGGQSVPDVEGLVQSTVHALHRRPDAVFELDHPEQVVPLLPAQELLYAIEEIGLRDATDLLALCTPEQVQSFLDLSVWHADRVDLEEADDWLEALLDLELHDFYRKLRRLDPELLATVLSQSVLVHELTEEDRDAGGLGGWRTPDTFYELLPATPLDRETGEPLAKTPETAARFDLVIQLMDRIYQADVDEARTMLQEAAAGTVAELEELAYRWRSGRLADLGYEPYAEACGVLQPVDPARLAQSRLPPDPAPDPRDPSEPATLGGVLLEPWVPASEETVLEAAIAALSPRDLDRITVGFTFLVNRLAAATLVRPGDADAVREVMRHARQRLNLGLDYLTHRQPGRAPEVFARLPVVAVFQVGHSLTLQLQRLVRTLHRRGRLSLAKSGASLLEGPWRDLVDSLDQRFPALTGGFDDPPGSAPRPILTLDDLSRAAQLVEDLASLWPLCFLGLRFDAALLTEQGLEGCRPSEPGAVRLGDLFRTAVLQSLIGEAFLASPLEPAQLERARRALADHRGDRATLEQEVLERVRSRLKAVAMPAPKRLERIVHIWLAPLFDAMPPDGGVIHRVQDSDIP